MRVLIINKFLYPNGGSETYIFKLGEALEQHGHEVQYFGMEHGGRCVGNRVNAYTSDMDFHGGSKLSKLTGRMMIAYGIQLSIDSGHGGIVTFEAKTDELYDHYIKDFHAVPIFQPHSGGPKLLMLADEGAQEIFSTYLS